MAVADHAFDVVDEDTGYQSCGDCGVQAEPVVAVTLAVWCDPAAACAHPSNRGGACVFTAEGPVVVCSYCDRPGGRIDGEEPDEDEGPGWELPDGWDTAPRLY